MDWERPVACKVVEGKSNNAGERKMSIDVSKEEASATGHLRRRLPTQPSIGASGYGAFKE
jgi:hypothetical protein